jgi:tRNA-2-methylthio-N6-dimethylallyladenosine synthase
VQSGADPVLAGMNRGYTREQYLDRVRRLREVCPELRLTTDLIVGFPGESEEDFAATLALVEEVRYADAFTFLFSPRPGTAAATLKDETPAALKQERFDRLLAVQERISHEIQAGDVGRTVDVLVEGASRRGAGQLFGRTGWNRIVNFQGGCELIGTVVPVHISRAYRNSHLGRLA